MLAVGFALPLTFRALRRARLQLAQQAPELNRARWHTWWVRNAAEMTRADPSRPYLVRLAYAAMLAPSLTQFEDDLDRIVRNPEAPVGLRNAAASFAQELQAQRLPWEVWAETTGKPPHVAQAVEFAYREALFCIPMGLADMPALDVPEE